MQPSPVPASSWPPACSSLPVSGGGPSVLWTIVKKEMLGHVLSYRFLVTTLLCFLLTLASVGLLLLDYRSEKENYDASVALHERDLASAESMTDLEVSGIVVERRPPPLSSLAKGMDVSAPRSVEFAYRSTPRAVGSRYRNPLLFLLPTPDLVYVVEVIVSLLAVLFMFDAVSGEKERGTLKLLLSNSVPRDLVLIGKYVGGYVTLLLPLSASLAAVLLLLHLAPWVDMTRELWLRTGWIVVVSLLYVSLFFALGILISALTKRASTSLIVSLFVWVILVIVMPNIAPLLAAQLSPSPSPEMVSAEQSSIRRDGWRSMRGLRDSGMSESERDEREAEMREQVARQQADVEAFARSRARRNVALARALGKVSPAAGLVYSATDLARTGVAAHFAFLEATSAMEEDVDRYLRGLRDGIDDLARSDPDLDADAAFAEVFDPEEAPRPRVVGLPLADTLRETNMDVLLLAVYNVLFLMGAYVAFMRYDAT